MENTTTSGCTFNTQEILGGINPPPEPGAIPPTGDLCNQTQCANNLEGICNYSE